MIKIAVYPGCIGSADATHVIIDKCYRNLKNQNLGGKSSMTTRAFQITVNHRRRILATTAGMPGRWNDKTVVRFDGFINDIYRGLRYKKVCYYLEDCHNLMQKYCGAWILVDGGYLSWSCTVNPLKESSSIQATRWSKWAEAIRKDVECTFGILKGRWRILKTGVRLRNLEVVDDIWYTCCALHNMLLQFDGLDKRWKEGIPSPYEGELGWHENGDVQRNVPLLFARANCKNSYLRKFDASNSVSKITTDYSDGFDSEESHYDPQNIEGKNISSITLKKFRQILIEHFNQKWLKNSVIWPSRNGVVKYTQ